MNTGSSANRPTGPKCDPDCAESSGLVSCGWCWAEGWLCRVLRTTDCLEGTVMCWPRAPSNICTSVAFLGSTFRGATARSECHCCPDGKGVFWAGVSRVGLRERVLFLCWNSGLCLGSSPKGLAGSPYLLGSPLWQSQTPKPSWSWCHGGRAGLGSRKPPAQGVCDISSAPLPPIPSLSLVSCRSVLPREGRGG